MFKHVQPRFFRITLLLSLVTLLLVQQITAQHEDLPAGTVVIVNPHTDAIIFWVKNDQSEWIWDKLNPGASKSYSYMNKLKLISNTNIVTVRSLAYKTRYKFAWNYNTRLWDIEVVP